MLFQNGCRNFFCIQFEEGIFLKGLILDTAKNLRYHQLDPVFKILNDRFKFATHILKFNQLFRIIKPSKNKISNVKSM